MISQDRLRAAVQIAERMRRNVQSRRGFTPQDDPGSFGIRLSEWPGVLAAALHGRRMLRLGYWLGVAVALLLSRLAPKAVQLLQGVLP